jgi:hypothetical protein
LAITLEFSILEVIAMSLLEPAPIMLTKDSRIKRETMIRMDFFHILVLIWYLPFEGLKKGNANGGCGKGGQGKKTRTTSPGRSSLLEVSMQPGTLAEQTRRLDASTE